MATIAEKICAEISEMTETKVISVSELTQAQHLEVYQISNIGYKIATILPYLSFMSFNREYLVFFDTRDETLIDIFIDFDSIFEVLEIVCAVRS